MDSARPFHLLFLCTGNICRSPMAEVLARAYAAERGWKIEVASGGVANIIGRGADPTAIKVMGEVGLDLNPHRSQGLTAELVNWADYILVMELAHSKAVRERFPFADEKVMLLGSFGGSYEIADPLGGWRWRFRRTRDQIKTCVESFIDQLPPRPA